MALTLVVLGAWGYRVFSLKPSILFFKNSALKAPDFAFPESNGGNFSSGALKGKVWVADFIFTHCAGTCPILSSNLSKLQDEWRGNPDFNLVSFTVDPKNDTVDTLRQYAEQHHAQKDQWFFLTGVKKDLYRTAHEGFKVTVIEDPQGIPGFEFVHTTRVFLVDANGMIRGFYDGSDEMDVQKLAQDVKYLMSSRSRT